MLAYFPTLYPDELLYSGFARYHLISGNIAQKQSISSLFDNKMVCATVDLPAHIKYLSKQLNNIYTVNQLIWNHTLYPYYSTFLSEEKAKQIYSLMSEGSPWGEVHISLGLAACIVKRPRYLKYCKECIKEDTNTYHESFWHRSHQVPGVYFCPIHKVELTESKISSPTRDHKFEFIPLSQVEMEQSISNITNPKWKSHLLFIAKYSYELLNNQNECQNISKSYKAHLNDKGYVTPKGRIRFKPIINDFIDFFSKDLLEYLNCKINLKSDDTWFHKIIRGKNGGTHPLRYILVHIFFGIEISQKLIKYNYPFGEGPWPCLNKAAEHFMKDAINECKVTRDSESGLPVGTFKCSCGFEYSRKGPDKSNEDRYRIGRIKSFGDVWLRKLNQINQQDISLRAKARLLGVDPMTVKNYTNHQNQENVYTNKQEHQDEKENRRKRFLASLMEAENNNNPIRQLNSKDYMWLFRHDREWLEQNMPQRKRVRRRGFIVDWQERDKVVLGEVKKAYKSLQGENKPKRITISELSRHMEGNLGNFLHNCLNKLTQTKEYLELIIETTEQFQIRRLEWAASELQKVSFKIKGWELLKLAGLNKPLKKGVALKYQELAEDVISI
ncbi:hypothetical protein FZC76_22375 [Sutcliffiella horikoshii]|uniref:Uncharacterized protein n=1 Tax=Sutcliffiella horikoshii TaxID=79883 RepID=A0A5D4S6P7_9BACI|nr:TnsD family Tn7-like transposition protein [Sutcliffiella horikoshii]TYS59357.1 hypothetical protein FZC76_22375 [Sutcliffiella horikoshii]